MYVYMYANVRLPPTHPQHDRQTRHGRSPHESSFPPAPSPIEIRARLNPNRDSSRNENSCVVRRNEPFGGGGRRIVYVWPGVGWVRHAACVVYLGWWWRYGVRCCLPAEVERGIGEDVRYVSERRGGLEGVHETLLQFCTVDAVSSCRGIPKASVVAQQSAILAGCSMAMDPSNMVSTRSSQCLFGLGEATVELGAIDRVLSILLSWLLRRLLLTPFPTLATTLLYPTFHISRLAPGRRPRR